MRGKFTVSSPEYLTHLNEFVRVGSIFEPRAPSDHARHTGSTDSFCASSKVKNVEPASPNKSSMGVLLDPKSIILSGTSNLNWPATHLTIVSVLNQWLSSITADKLTFLFCVPIHTHIISGMVYIINRRFAWSVV